MKQPEPKKKIHYTGKSKYKHDVVINCSPETCLHRLQHMAASNDNLELDIPVEFDGGARFVLRYYRKDRRRVTVQGVLRRWEGTKTSVHVNQTNHHTWLMWVIAMTFAISLFAMIPMMLVAGITQSAIATLVLTGMMLAWIGSIVAAIVHTPFDDAPPNMVLWLQTTLRRPLEREATHSPKRKITEGGMTTYRTGQHSFQQTSKK